MIIRTLAYSVACVVLAFDGAFPTDKPITWADVLSGCVIQQQYDFSCGPAALATILKHEFGAHDISEQTILNKLIMIVTDDEQHRTERQEALAEARKRCGDEVSFEGNARKELLQNGASLIQLWCLAILYDYAAFIRKATPEFLVTKLDRPIIVHLTIGSEQKHFAVLRKVVGRWVYLADPARGCKVYLFEQFLLEWKRREILILHHFGGYIPFKRGLAIPNKNIDQQRRDAVRRFFHIP